MSKILIITKASRRRLIYRTIVYWIHKNIINPHSTIEVDFSDITKSQSYIVSKCCNFPSKDAPFLAINIF